MSVEWTQSLDSVRQFWSALAVLSDNVFATWEWLEAWWSHFGRDRRLVLLTCRRPDDTVAAIVPFYLAHRRGVKIVRFLGHGPSDQLGPLCHMDDRVAVMQAVRQFFDGNDVAWDLLIADELPGETDWSSVLQGTVLARQPSPFVDLGGGYSAWLSQRTPNFRTQLRRAASSLEKRGVVEYRTTTEPDTLERDFDTLVALHDARWRSQGGSRAFVGRLSFHRQVTASMLAAGNLRLRTLSVDGQPVAALYNLCFNGTESFYQSGRDPAFGSYSVGLLIHDYAIRQAGDERFREYRLLRGGEAYKGRLADQNGELVSVAVANSRAGHAVARSIAVEPSLPRWALRRVPSALAWGTGGSPMWGQP